MALRNPISISERVLKEGSVGEASNLLCLVVPCTDRDRNVVKFREHLFSWLATIIRFAKSFELWRHSYSVAGYIVMGVA